MVLQQQCDRPNATLIIFISTALWTGLKLPFRPTCKSLQAHSLAYAWFVFQPQTDYCPCPHLKSGTVITSSLLGHSVLRAPVAWWCRLLDCLLSVAGALASLVLVWNGLPEDVVLAPLLSTFRRRLKTYLYKQYYPDLALWLSIRHLNGPCGDNVT